MLCRGNIIEMLVPPSDYVDMLQWLQNNTCGQLFDFDETHRRREVLEQKQLNVDFWSRRGEISLHTLKKVQLFYIGFGDPDEEAAFILRWR